MTKLALSFLESLPIGTDEYDDFKKRIRNADRYANAHEFGAVQFELKLLLKRLPDGA